MLVVCSCGSSKKVSKTKTYKRQKKEQKINDKNKKEVVTTTSKTEPKKKPVKAEEPEVVKKETPEVFADKNEEYIAIYSDIAQEEMRNYGIPASITLAQGILESGSGQGRLSVEANNHFGIKCHEWTGERIYHDDDKEQECFRKYNNSLQSFNDHSKFLRNRKRYSKLFSLPPNDYQAWAKGLRAAGYATDKKYPKKLIQLIERYQLYRFDSAVLGIPSKHNQKHTVEKGDTLYSISKKYNISVEEIQQLNGLEGTTVYIGQTLFVKPLPKE